MTEKPTYEELEKRIQILEKLGSEHQQTANIFTKDRLKYQQLTEAMADVIILISPTGKLLYVSPNVKKFGGYDHEDELGNDMSKYFEKDTDYIRAVELLEKVLKNHDSGSFEFLFKPKNKKPFPVEHTYYPILKNNKVTVIQLILRDITKRKQREIALLESENRIRSVLETMPVLLDAFDENGNIIIWNDECERITGYSADDIIGNANASELLYPDEGYKKFLMDQLAQYGGNFRNLEWDINCKNGTKKTILWSNMSDQFPIPGWHSWAVGIDITDRKHSELKQSKINKRLEEKVEERTAALKDMNTALKVLLDKREKDKKETKKKLFKNYHTLILPFLQKLTNSLKKEDQKILATILESNLQELLESFSEEKLNPFINLSPAELQVANMVKKGLSNKEIALALHKSVRTITNHRDHIRKKLGIINTKINLQSFLLQH